MRWLPALVAGPTRCVLPMADRSAAVLLDVILADDEALSTEWLAEQLAMDPPLVLWAVCAARGRDGFRPCSVRDVAQWFREHLLDVLRWERGDEAPPDASSPQYAEHCADRVAKLLQVAELSALLAASEGQAAAEEAFLNGILHDALAWLTTAPGPTPETPPDCLPDWLTASSDTPPGLRANEAVRILDGEETSAPNDFDPQACRRRAWEARRCWLEAVEGPVDRLPQLTAKLFRLQQLEHRFQATLETEKLEALAEFAAGAGHEINNPLAIIGGRAQLLLKDETDPERRRELALVNAQVKRAHEMIADMRLFARPPQPEPETVDLVALVDRLLGDLGPQASERAISLSRSGDEGPMEIEADPAQLDVALRAVCRNALEAIGHRGHVEIGVHRLPGRVEIRVTDDGPGILPEHRRHLFDPFYSSRQAGRGLGFGLSKCWRIVTNHGGRIEVESEPGQGATFRIMLPT
jgi:signal transduction histidine kinase